MAADAETFRLSTMPHIGMRRNSSAEAITSSEIPRAPCRKPVRKAPWATSKVSGVTSLAVGRGGHDAVTRPRGAAMASAVEGCCRTSIHRSAPRAMSGFGSKEHKGFDGVHLLHPDASQWRISAAAFCPWYMFSASTVM